MALAIKDKAVAADTDHRLHVAIANVCRNNDLRSYVTSLLARASGPHWRAAQEAARRHPRCSSHPSPSRARIAAPVNSGH